MKNRIYEMFSKQDKKTDQDDIDTMSNLPKSHEASEIDISISQRGLSVSSEEENTISYQLGKSIIDAAKRKTTIKRFSKELSSLYVESLRRKNKYLTNASLLEKIVILLDDKELQENYYLEKRNLVENKLEKEPTLVKALEHQNQYKGMGFKGVDNVAETSIFSPNIQSKELASLQERFIGKNVKIAAIMDEFTSFCFDPEANFLHLTPDSWEVEIDYFKPDLLFIESAWKGKDDLWKLKVSQCSEDLQKLIDGCNQRGIKTVFWSKEDPVHFGTFLDVAKKVDVVFTTDIDCIKKYKEHVNHDDVFLLPFAAQPKLHNPIELYERKNKFNFAGSYYLKYPRRQRDFEVLSSVAKDTKGLDIFDRNFNKPHPHYQFPHRFEPMILGSLAPHEIDKAYKGYHYGINMNTIKQSQTMFARRVFEMLASNTIVMSNYSRGVRLLFGDLVICSDNETELTRQLERLESDLTTREKFKLQGLRHVLKDHTYKHRLKYILQKTFKTNLNSQGFSTTVVSYIKNEHEYDRLIESYERQKLVNKRLIILSEVTINASLKQDVNILNTKEDFVEAIEQLANESSIAVFNPNDSYGKHYLSDFVLSYSYLSSDSKEGVRLTKNSYFENTNDTLSLVSGVVYGYIDNISLSRSLFTLDDFKNNIIDKIELQEINNAQFKLKAFSTDGFSYVLNGSELSESALSVAHEDLTIDEGVDFLNKLLPLSESIRGFNDTTELTKTITINTLLATANKYIEVTKLENNFQIKSSLPAKQHRYINILDKLALVGASEVHTYLDIHASNNIELVFEYFDSKGQKTSFEIKKYTPFITVDVINNSAFMSINIRIKGSSSLVLSDEFKLQLISNNRVIESHYQDPRTFIFDAAEIDKQLVRPQSKQIAIGFKDGLTEIKSTLADDKFAYVYFKTIYHRDDINLKLNSHYTVEAESDFDVRQVFVFLDENKEKISHNIVKVENSHTMPIPTNCKFIKIGYKLSGSGTTRIKSLMIGETVEAINSLVCKSDTLILAKQYPAYDDLYKYGFLHSRLRSYKNNGFYPDMFKIINSKSGEAFREFESIDVFNGNKNNLREVLSSGQVKNVFVHLLDKDMWEVLTDFKDVLNISIWLHGAEVQSWKRREFDFVGSTKDETSKKKRLADNRVKFWQKLIKEDLNSRVKLIFVSKTFLHEVESDLGFDIPNGNKLVIHNYVDSNIFKYSEKEADDRFKLLSIRPYMGPKYGNDITVQAIQELANYEFFNKLEISVYGDGPEFDSINRPLLEYDNVHLHKRFLSHSEIVDVHKENGVFLNPTRWDSQGVSRDEAMSSGLVVVTNKVAAVPEFISDKEGALFEGENIHEMVKEIVKIIKNPTVFLDKSKAARGRVGLQCGFDNTIAKEIELIK
ncbi:spore maturation protein CgeB [Psychrobacter immobilis]|uniref:Spore maturation protein CgeB n=1 Tax=Psychrobacter immobilis TaxID=498 RepID=A0A2V2A5B7_PSYIM|nr:glycosyltransferase [Psychrobacter immobilis]PWK14646.1 spore maturation protein CgeB [Psychrobacter immobilis]